MVLMKCNICGAIEGTKKAKFSKETLKLKIPGYNGKMYCLDLFIDIIYEEDLKRVMNFRRKQSEGPEAMIKQILGNKNAQADVQKIPIEEPYAAMCDECKSKLSYLLIEGGMCEGYNEF